MFGATTVTSALVAHCHHPPQARVRSEDSAELFAGWLSLAAALVAFARFTRSGLGVHAVCRLYGLFEAKNPVFDKLLYEGRHRFQRCLLLSRQDGMRKIIKAMRDGYSLYYLPDMDFGPDDSIFVPFFGVPAATIPGVSRLTRLTGAKVVACITRQVADGYEVEITPAWDNFPGASVEADTEFVNRFIESQVLRMPEQYFWLHKRFKTRPPGEQRFYK
ncbi:MAG: lipid A biosynthesis acyltransferase [Dechloromonas sp.]|uniref:Lipid A biosynthesis acyltransferase n=1 Tax=Candidatus Dechloromonas phosphorivorans TaxID=2899244 RepID=A0A935MPK7_9RHOO|nr:lipid A biosynthesis acyltransferase [Candidatus Dechloromonas phosphorivorans]